LAECGYPTHRVTLTSLFQSFWPLGSTVAALVTWGPYQSSLKNSNWAWRIPSLLQGFIPIISCVLLFFGPESPRWLISKGKYDQALDFFAKYQGDGDPSSNLVQYQMAEISATLEAEKAQKLSKWTEWFASKAMLHRLFITMFLPVSVQLLGNAIISYYLHLILNSVGITEALTQLKINVGLNAWGLVWDLVFANIVFKVRRKLLLIGGFTLCGIAFIIFTILSAFNQQRNFKDKPLAYGAVVMIFAFQGVYHISSPVIPTYVMEICPFSLRAKGSVIYTLVGGVIGLFNNYVNPIAMAAIAWKYYIVYDVWIFVQVAIVYFFIPETYKLGLEEVARVFGDELVHGDDTAERFRQFQNPMSEKNQEVVHVEEA
jgi:hypothetical protein